MKFETKQIVYAAFFPLIFVILLWIVLGIEWGFNTNWNQLGVYPRSIRKIYGLLTSPLIHSSVKHLFSNSIPLLILGWCLFYFYKDLGYLVFPIVWVLSGSITWCIGRESWHIGASGLVYALSFFLFFSGIFRKYTPLLAISMLVVFLYGSTVWSIFPISEWVDINLSWEGHLSGAFSGLLCAILFRSKGPQKPEPFPEENLEEDNESDENTVC